MLSILSAAVLAFTQPVECRLGKECFIQNYVDLDASPERKDYTCGFLTYDGHKGTDFRIMGEKAMKDGVRVLAAADGEVLRLRDGEADISFRKRDNKAIEGKECGNGMVIEHENGYNTQYCHLKQGSLLVKEGEKVKKGQPIGEIGMSGKTEFPHLHFQITDDAGNIIDPFSGIRDEQVCGKSMYESLWDSQTQPVMTYTGTQILDAGFWHSSLSAQEAYSGYSHLGQMPRDADAFIIWTTIIGVKQGDALLLQLAGPDGENLVNHAKKITGNKVQYFQFAGKRGGQGQWKPGVYRGLVELLRGPDGGQLTVARREMTIEVKADEAVAPGN